MNPNVSLEEVAPEEYEVYLRSTYCGTVYLNFWDNWTAVDVRDGEYTSGFDTLEDAVNWLVGW